MKEKYRNRERPAAMPLARSGKIVIFDRDFIATARKYRWSTCGAGGNYAGTIVKGKTILMHRMITNVPSDKVVDHINHDTLDNRISNLRIATCKENSANTRKHFDGKASYKGVYHHVKKNRWSAKIQNNFIGFFRTEKQAAAAYNDAARERFREFACLNEFTSDEEAFYLRTGIEGQRKRTSKFRGVSYMGRRALHPWKANIHANGNNHYLGSFKVEEEAAYAYDQAVRRMNVSPTRLNGVVRHRRR